VSRTYHLATFFKAFSLKPRGRYCISVCLGTACHVAGGVKIIEQLERELKVTRGGTTTDMNFSLDEVHCLGCCGLAPVATVNEDVHGKLTLSKVPAMLKKYIKKD
jgi:NADH:ubiquinone oxidoreductase subunit E